MSTRQSLRIVAAVLAGLSALVSAQSASDRAPAGVSYEGQPVASVDLVGDPRIDVNSFRSLIAQSPGQPYSEKKYRQAPGPSSTPAGSAKSICG